MSNECGHLPLRGFLLPPQLPGSWLRHQRVTLLQQNTGIRPASLQPAPFPWVTLSSLPRSSQGSLLKVVLDDYMRLKKLFAQRMVHKATASQGDRSSVSEVDGVCMGVGRCLPCPLGCSVSSRPPQAVVAPRGHRRHHPVFPPFSAWPKRARCWFSTEAAGSSQSLRPSLPPWGKIPPLCRVGSVHHLPIALPRLAKKLQVPARTHRDIFPPLCVPKAGF